MNTDRPLPLNNQTGIFYKTDIAVIGAGQAGLSAAYHLKREGVIPGRGFVVLDDEFAAGGAWQHRWDSLTLNNVNGINDLPGLSISEAGGFSGPNLRANLAIPAYYQTYEETFQLPIIRPVRVHEVLRRRNGFLLKTNGPQFSVRGIINATGTWKNPHCPKYPGWEKFKGRQLHTGEYTHASEFSGKHVVLVGGGISAVQLLGEISEVTRTTWVVRRPPDFRKYRFTQEEGRKAVKIVEERVRAGLPPESVVSVTGLPITPAIASMMEKGTLEWKPMFQEVTENGVRWSDGASLDADVIFWNTGFKHDLDHLSDLQLENDRGGIAMSGKAATQVKDLPEIHLTGYGPSASTIGANRAGRLAVKELLETLAIK